MKFDEFQKMDLVERSEYVNSILAETQDLRAACDKLELSYSGFCKEMRVGGYTFNQSKKCYEKTLSIQEYKEIQQHLNRSGDSSDVIQFITEHFDELKELLKIHAEQLVLNPTIYDPSIDMVTKTFQINSHVFKEFSDLCTTKFGHLQTRHIISQCLYEFIQNYKEKPPTE